MEAKIEFRSASGITLLRSARSCFAFFESKEEYAKALEKLTGGSSGEVPKLYEAVLLGFAPIAFRLRGFERVEGPDGGSAVVQEWHCEMP